MYRIPWILLLCWCSGRILEMPTLLRGEEPPPNAKLQKLADESRSRAEDMQVSVAEDNRTTKATLHPNAIMKYTDVPRDIEMATLWVWHIEGQPVALAKVEAYRRPGGTKWLYCFASLSTGLVESRWPDGRRFKARKPGIEWKALEGPVPQEKATDRLRQMKALFRHFSATAKDEVLKTSDKLRPLARPLREYSSPKRGVLQGVVCGFAANGTNPDAIIVLEAVLPAKGKDAPKTWRYGMVSMTALGISVKFDEKEVYTWPYIGPPGDHDTWTYFWEGEAKK